MRLHQDFITHNTGRESIMVSAGESGFSGMVRGNKTLGIILELLKTETTEEELAAALHARFEAPEGAIERDVHRAVQELRRIGALDE